MKYKMSITPAIEKTGKSKVFHYETYEQMIAAKDTASDLLLFIQDDISVMTDFSNDFHLQELIDGEWTDAIEF